MQSWYIELYYWNYYNYYGLYYYIHFTDEKIKTQKAKFS